MSRTHDYYFSHYIQIGASEIECDIAYRVEPGFAGDRIDPPYEASVEVLNVTVILPGGKRDIAPQWLIDIIASDDGLCDDMLYEAGEPDASDADRADDIRDQRRDDALTPAPRLIAAE